MELIYGNMAKLFDTFTQGALTGQGANSEILLRTVYRSLNDDFLKIIQDTDATDKIVELLKQKQESIAAADVDKAMVSETTKKVITKTLDPNDLDPMSVILDFVDELQTAILQVKLNLTREYERQKLAYAKSKAGQTEDLDRLNSEFMQQSDDIMGTLRGMKDDESIWKDETLKKLDQLGQMLGKFAELDDGGYSAQVDDAFKDLMSEAKEAEKRQLPAFKKNVKDVKFNPLDAVEKMKRGAVKQEPPALSKKQDAMRVKTLSVPPGNPTKTAPASTRTKVNKQLKSKLDIKKLDAKLKDQLKEEVREEVVKEIQKKLDAEFQNELKGVSKSQSKPNKPSKKAIKERTTIVPKGVKPQLKDSKLKKSIMKMPRKDTPPAPTRLTSPFARVQKTYESFLTSANKVKGKVLSRVKSSFQVKGIQDKIKWFGARWTTKRVGKAGTKLNKPLRLPVRQPKVRLAPAKTKKVSAGFKMGPISPKPVQKGSSLTKNVSRKKSNKSQSEKDEREIIDLFKKNVGADKRTSKGSKLTGKKSTALLGDKKNTAKKVPEKK